MRRRWRNEDERGNLLLLAGIILVLSFVTTALTLGQIADLEKQAAVDQQAPLLIEYRFIREKIGSTLRDATASSTDNQSFTDIFKSMKEEFQRVAHEKGYDLVIERAGYGAQLNRSEWNYTSWGWPERFDEAGTADDEWANGGRAFPDDGIARLDETTNLSNDYWVRSSDNRVLVGPAPWGNTLRDWDGVNDGIFWMKPCLIDNARGCIQAILIYVSLADSTSSIEEYIVFSMNAN